MTQHTKHTSETETQEAPSGTNTGETPTAHLRATSRAGRTERGEGVISTAIAVLVIAFLGVAMWVGFQAIFDDASQSTREQVELIGQ